MKGLDSLYGLYLSLQMLSVIAYHESKRKEAIFIVGKKGVWYIVTAIIALYIFIWIMILWI